MPRLFQLGDRVRVRRYKCRIGSIHLGSMGLGTVQRINFSAECLYEVLMDATGEVYLVAEWDLALAAGDSDSALLSGGQACEVGRS